MNATTAALGEALLLAAFGTIAYERSRAYRVPISPLRLSALVPSLAAVALARFVGSHAADASTADAPAKMIAIACAAVSATSDIQTGYVFDRLLLAAAIVLFPFVFQAGRCADALSGAAIASGALLLPYVGTRGRGIGLGDVKLAGVVGFALGSAGALAAITSAIICGGCVAAVLLAARRVGRHGVLPFGPFLAIGASYAVVRMA